jgi:hypothetical protein
VKTIVLLWHTNALRGYQESLISHSKTFLKASLPLLAFFVLFGLGGRLLGHLSMHLESFSGKMCVITLFQGPLAWFGEVIDHESDSLIIKFVHGFLDLLALAFAILP